MDPNEEEKTCLHQKKADIECIICFHTLENKNITVLQCGHFYHTECFRKWSSRGGTCPLCRSNDTKILYYMNESGIMIHPPSLNKGSGLWNWCPCISRN
jgi:hypothetical protein